MFWKTYSSMKIACLDMDNHKKCIFWSINIYLRFGFIFKFHALGLIKSTKHSAFFTTTIKLRPYIHTCIRTYIYCTYMNVFLAKVLLYICCSPSSIASQYRFSYPTCITQRNVTIFVFFISNMKRKIFTITPSLTFNTSKKKYEANAMFDGFVIHIYFGNFISFLVVHTICIWGFPTKDRMLNKLTYKYIFFGYKGKKQIHFYD